MIIINIILTIKKFYFLIQSGLNLYVHNFSDNIFK